MSSKVFQNHGVELWAAKVRALKFTCKSKDEVPAELASHCVERNGAWVLDVEGVGISAERDALTARLSAIQMDQAVVSEATRKGLRPSAIPENQGACSQSSHS